MLNQVFGLAISFSLINTNVGANINLETPTISLYPQEYQQALIQKQTISNYQVENSYITSQSNPAFTNIKQQEEQKIKEEEEEKKRRQREENRKKQIAKQKKARLKKLQAQSSQKKFYSGPVNGDYQTLIRRACAKYGCNPSQLIRVMYCESGGRANAKNPRSNASGLFQFMPRTFYANARRAGLQNANLWNPYHQIQTAAWMFANGQAHQWVCK